MKTPEERLLRIADLVDDNPAKRERVRVGAEGTRSRRTTATTSTSSSRSVWRRKASTDLVRSRAHGRLPVEPHRNRAIIGRATRDAPGKTRARFTNLIAEPDASEEAVAEAVNDTLKAIAASPADGTGARPTVQLPAEERKTAFRSRASTMAKRATTPRSATSDSITKRDSSMSRSRDSRCRRERRPSGICNEDLNEVIAAFAQDKVAVERGLFDEELVPEEPDPGTDGQDRPGTVPRTHGSRSGGGAPTRRRGPEPHPESDRDRTQRSGRFRRTAAGEHRSDRRRSQIRHGRA